MWRYFFIPEYVQRFPNEVATTQTYTELEAALDALTESTNKLKQEKKRLLKRKSDLVNDVERLRQEINNKLDDFEENIEENFKSMEDMIDLCLTLIKSKKGDFSVSKSKVVSTFDFNSW